MSKKVNERFLDAYLELDKACCKKFGTSSGGVTEYVNRLSSARFAPDRDEVLPRLVRYRNMRNIFAHEPSAIKKNGELVKSDVVWVRRFTSYLVRKKDPISAYLRKARRYARHRRIKRYIVAGAIVVVVIIGIILYFQITK